MNPIGAYLASVLRRLILAEGEAKRCEKQRAWKQNARTAMDMIAGMDAASA